jgi:hypothetical protein
MDDCRAWVDAHPESKRPVYHVPHSKGVVGLAANFVMHIAEQMQSGAGPRPAAASQAAPSLQLTH